MSKYKDTMPLVFVGPGLTCTQLFGYRYDIGISDRGWVCNEGPSLAGYEVTYSFKTARSPKWYTYLDSLTELMESNGIDGFDFEAAHEN